MMPSPWSLQRPGSRPKGRNRRYPCGPPAESGGSAFWSWSAVTAWSRPRGLLLRVGPAEELAEDASGRDITKDAYAVASPNALCRGRMDGALVTRRARLEWRESHSRSALKLAPLHLFPSRVASMPRPVCRAPLGWRWGRALARRILPQGRRLSETRSTVLTGNRGLLFLLQPLSPCAQLCAQRRRPFSVGHVPCSMYVE
jgi:hypothetical protein